MMLTEEEARKKWCPFTRNGGEPGCNRLSSTECIASDCMAWRSTVQRVDRVSGVTPEGDGYEKSGPEWRETDFGNGSAVVFQAWTRTVGHCGLAGKP